MLSALLCSCANAIEAVFLTKKYKKRKSAVNQLTFMLVIYLSRYNGDDACQFVIPPKCEENVNLAGCHSELIVEISGFCW